MTKAIMALPYKLAEFLLGILFSKNKLNLEQVKKWHLLPRGMAYFPHNPLLNFLVELMTPALVAMFLAMIIAYLTSDKRVFQRKKIIRFIASAALVFTLWFCLIYGLYSNSLNKIKRLEDIKSITIYEETENSSSWLVRIDKDNRYEEKYSRIMSELSQGERLDHHPGINEREGLRLNITFKGGGLSMAHIDMDEAIMLMQDHTPYQLSDSLISSLLELKGGINNEN